MIVITGATGALNGSTLKHLLETVPAGGIAAVVRDPSKAGALASRGVEIRQGDYARPETLVPAFAGADQLLLVSSNDQGADAVALHRNAVEAAVEAGVGRILYTSHQGTAADSPFAPARDHAATEELLAASGLPWTSLRNGFYAHTLGWATAGWRESGVIAVPADGPISWTAREDAAQAAAAVILSDGGYEGLVTLTAPDAPHFTRIAEIASELAGRPVERVVLDPEEWVARQVAVGAPEAGARFLLGMYLAAAEGYFSGTDPLLGTLLGREPASARDALIQADAR